MAVKVYLVSADKVKEETTLNGNIDNKMITPWILACQDTDIESITGTDLLAEIKAQVQAGTLSVLNTTLLNDYIIPALVYYVSYNTAYGLWVTFNNKNAGKKSSDNTSPVDNDELGVAKSRFERLANNYGERLRLYLKENSSNYPLYCHGNNELYKQRPSNTAYKSGFYLGNPRPKKGQLYNHEDTQERP